MNLDRREFLKTSALAAGAAVTGCATTEDPLAGSFHHQGLAWADLIHVSTNMWGSGTVDPDVPVDMKEESGFWPKMRFEQPVFDRVTRRMTDIGMNMIVLDLGDAIIWPSHPELAIEGSWTPEKLRQELKRLRSMGLEPIPKLNFSCGHHAWLKQYSRMVSTPKYYQVCADLIRDTMEIFGEAPYFHFGFDEEFAAAQKGAQLVVIRQGDLWWHDLFFLAKEAEKYGARAWIWSDKIWHDRENFRRRMPKSIVQSSWYYFDDFKYTEWDDEVVKGKEWRQSYCSIPAFKQMAEWGYDQIPCGSNVYRPGSFAKLVTYLKKNMKVDEHLLGFLMAPWGKMTTSKFDYEMRGLADAEAAIKAWNA